MDTFEIKNGDIAIDSTGKLSLIGGAQKVSQDLRNFLLNEIGFSRFHPWIGSHLDDFVGQTIDSTLIQKIKSDVRDCLNLYTENQMLDLRKRIEERGNPSVAVAQADPSSLVKSWSQLNVYDDGTSIFIKIGFITYTGEEDSTDIQLNQGNYITSSLP